MMVRVSELQRIGFVKFGLIGQSPLSTDGRGEEEVVKAFDGTLNVQKLVLLSSLRPSG